MSQTIETNPLPTTLRALRVGLDDDLYVRRTVHLAASKIEDLEEQVARLAAELQMAAPIAGGRRSRGASRPSRH